MIIDLHTHFPMHIDPAGPVRALQAMRQKKRESLGDRLRAFIIRLACRIDDYPDPNAGPAVTIPHLREGNVGVVLSVLYCPFEEMDLGKHYGDPPDDHYFVRLTRFADAVEAHLTSDGPRDVAVLARSGDEMRAALRDGKIAFLHAVEGGFHFGASPEKIRKNVATFARRGLAYITPAHLFYRGVATNAPALPFLPDVLYKMIFPEPSSGLTDLGRAMIEQMLESRVLIDVTHMSEASMKDTFELLDRIDPARRVPVIASHIACRIGALEYNLQAEWVKRIAERGGVMGVILCDHYARDGIRQARTKTFADSLEIIYRQIDTIVAITGSTDHVAIGSDLDGFIKPTLAELDGPSAFPRLEEALVNRYGSAAAEQFASGNALRVLDYWGAARDARVDRAG
jgi:microsomal dipeptidase-like Zn-dependent dipeptidase